MVVLLIDKILSSNLTFADMRNVLVLIILFCAANSCKTKYIPTWVKPEDSRMLLVEKRSFSSPCTATKNYIPNSENKRMFSERKLNIVVHFMNHMDSLQNYNEPEAKIYAKDIINSINNSLTKIDQWLYRKVMKQLI